VDLVKRGEYLLRIIEEKGFNVMSLSKTSGVPYTTIRSMIERDLVNASIDNVLKICAVLGIKAESLNNENLKELDDSITIAAHHDGERWTEEELEEIERFKEFVKMRRQQKGE
jgi:transcriptional regulator with XRE-family HTH domain